MKWCVCERNFNLKVEESSRRFLDEEKVMTDDEITKISWSRLENSKLKLVLKTEIK